MKKEISNRVTSIADYIISTDNTIREAAKEYKISKSTVHKDLNRIHKIDPKRGKAISQIMENHKNTRHIKGGEVTKEKYKKLRK